MTATEMLPRIGTTIQVRFELLIIPCTVVDVTNVWGKTRYLIQPACGEGRQWIELGRIVN